MSPPIWHHDIPLPLAAAGLPQFSNDAITILGFYCNAEPLSTEMFLGCNPNREVQNAYRKVEKWSGVTSLQERGIPGIEKSYLE
jgi:hypothetical protein